MLDCDAHREGISHLALCWYTIGVFFALVPLHAGCDRSGVGAIFDRTTRRCSAAPVIHSRRAAFRRPRRKPRQEHKVHEAPCGIYNPADPLYLETPTIAEQSHSQVCTKHRSRSRLHPLPPLSGIPATAVRKPA